MSKVLLHEGKLLLLAHRRVKPWTDAAVSELMEASVHSEEAAQGEETRRTLRQDGPLENVVILSYWTRCCQRLDKVDSHRDLWQWCW